MTGMAQYPDKYFQLAIVDPPYFSGPEKRKYYGSEFSGHGVKRRDYKPLLNSWVIPDNTYYQELLRVSVNQIIWGINYFNTFVHVPVGRIVWDKINEQTTFSNCEIASCSLIKTVKIIRFMWAGMMQGSTMNGSIMNPHKKYQQQKIHPTEKPIHLYKKLLRLYATPGDKILDTHLGSGSSRIAAYDMGFDFTGYEIDVDYFQAQEKRFKDFISQLKMAL